MKALDTDKDGKLSAEEIAKRYSPASFGIADSDRDGYITEASVRVSDKSVMWRYKRGLPYVPSPVLYQGVLYIVRTGGIVTALDVETGQVVKEACSPDATGEYFASPVAGGGKIYLASAEGKVSVLKAGPDWRVLGVNDLGESISASPSIADGAIFIGRIRDCIAVDSVEITFRRGTI